VRYKPVIATTACPYLIGGAAISTNNQSSLIDNQFKALTLTASRRGRRSAKALQTYRSQRNQLPRFLLTITAPKPKSKSVEGSGT